jgi:hypothetical protein
MRSGAVLSGFTHSKSVTRHFSCELCNIQLGPLYFVFLRRQARTATRIPSQLPPSPGPNTSDNAKLRAAKSVQHPTHPRLADQMCAIQPRRQNRNNSQRLVIGRIPRREFA